MSKPALFGLTHCNRDFENSKGESSAWSKNNFNATFPTALACYMHSIDIHPVYLMLDANGNLVHDKISVAKLFGIDPLSNDVYYAFESEYGPYKQLVVGSTPRVDLVVETRSTSAGLRGLEIKLTALPDNSTAELTEAEYGSELVVRPDTIVYLALSIAKSFKESPSYLKSLFQESFSIPLEWLDSDLLLPHVPTMVTTLNRLMNENPHIQEPLLMQPIWKTEGKSSRLHENAFDIFVWSNFALTRLFFRATLGSLTKITRPVRSIVWLLKMLIDFADNLQFDHKKTIDELSHATKNDKAFSINGTQTHPFMKSEELLNPRISRDALRNIILGGGQHLLSPERRLDAIIVNSPALFETEESNYEDN